MKVEYAFIMNDPGRLNSSGCIYDKNSINRIDRNDLRDISNFFIENEYDYIGNISYCKDIPIGPIFSISTRINEYVPNLRNLDHFLKMIWILDTKIILKIKNTMTREWVKINLSNDNVGLSYGSISGNVLVNINVYEDALKGVKTNKGTPVLDFFDDILFDELHFYNLTVEFK